MCRKSAFSLHRSYDAFNDICSTERYLYDCRYGTALNKMYSRCTYLHHSSFIVLMTVMKESITSPMNVELPETYSLMQLLSSLFYFCRIQS